MQAFLRQLVVGLAITLLATGLGFSQPTPQTAPGPGPSKPVTITDVKLPASFGPQYGTVLDLMDDLNSKQAMYRAAKTPTEKAMLANEITNLLQAIIFRAMQLKETLEDNKYVAVPGFTVGLGVSVPPTFSLTLDFTFKPRK